MLILPKPYKRVDDRGVLTELTRGVWKQVNLLEVAVNKQFGGHYHKNKTELFYVLSGIVVFTIATKTTLTTQLIGSGERIQVDPYDQHTLVSCADSVVVEMMSEEFDEKDTFKYGDDND